MRQLDKKERVSAIVDDVETPRTEAEIVPLGFNARISTPAGADSTAQKSDGQPAWLARAAAYREVQVSLDESESVLWAYMAPVGRPSVTPGLAREARDLQQALRASYLGRPDESLPFRYMVWGSAIPGTFNLGGDLTLFAELIREGDREALSAYATACIDVVYANAVSLDLPVITISLVQGDALGGGFEAAVSGDVVVAERSVKFALPEILFNLFPGMGAYSLIARRIGAVHAERLITSGKVYSAKELHEIGLVDILVEDGTGYQGVLNYVRETVDRHSAMKAIYRARQTVNPVSYAELHSIAQDWVEAASSLTESDLRKMERLAKAQDRRRVRDQGKIAAE